MDAIAVLYACANEDISLEEIRRLFCLTPLAFSHILANAEFYLSAWEQKVQDPGMSALICLRVTCPLEGLQCTSTQPEARGTAGTANAGYRWLSGNDQEVVLQLHEQENLSQREIARIMQIGPATVNRVVSSRPRALQAIENHPPGHSVTAGASLSAVGTRNLVL